MSWFARRSEARQSPFGPLEWRVLSALWDRNSPASVRDLQPDFTDIAYTTLMTTMDRLHRKEMLTRTKLGRAFFYRPRFTRPEYESARAAEALSVALDGDSAAVGSLLSFFVEAVGNRDQDLLDDLEALVRTRRSELGKKRP